MNYMKYYDPAMHDSLDPMDAAADIADYIADYMGAGDDTMIDLLIHEITKQVAAMRAG